MRSRRVSVAISTSNGARALQQSGGVAPRLHPERGVVARRGGGSRIPLVSDRAAAYNLTTAFVDRHVVEGRGGRPAIRFEGRVWTYQDIVAAVNRAGNLLKALGVQEEQRVLIVLPDSPDFAIAYFAAIKIGAVAVPTNPAMAPADYRRCLDDSRARVVITTADLVPRLLTEVEASPFVRHLLVASQSACGLLSWHEALAAQSPALEAAPTTGDDVAFWLWTSGTTGSAKAAVHLHQDWRHCCEGYARGVLDIGSGDVTFSSSKLFHAYGLGNALMFPFHVGAATILHPGKPLPEVVLKIVERERPSLFFSVPTLYASILRTTDGRQSHDFSSVRLAVSAAEPLPADLFLRWKQRFGVEILDGLGSTELLHIYLSARSGRVKPGSVGRPVPGYDVRLIDAEGQPVADGEIGDLTVGGRSTALYYWNRREATTGRMRGERFYTGDKASRDSDGDYWLAGRADDMFRVSGEWISPIELESALVAHPAVLEAAVVPYHDDHGLMKAAAYVVLAARSSPSDELIHDLQAFVKTQLAHYKCPRLIRFVDGLPKTAVGKVQRFRLRGTVESTSALADGPRGSESLGARERET